VVYHINGRKRENTTLPQPTGTMGANKQRLPFLEKPFRVKNDHILGPECLGSGSEIKSSQKGHEDRQMILFRAPVTRPIYDSKGTGMSLQERVILSSLETIFILSKPE